MADAAKASHSNEYIEWKSMSQQEFPQQGVTPNPT
jgi:hypothetical protein